MLVPGRWWGYWKTRNAQEQNGTEQNGTEPEVIVVQYGGDAGHVARNLRTVRFCVRTLISRSVTATKTEQAPTVVSEPDP